MVELQNNYKENIIKMFGQIGEEWLKKVPQLVEKYIDKFSLTNIKLLKDLTYNVLIFADSNDFGPVVLKIEIPFKELTIRESEALLLNDGVGACRCYYKDIEDGVILMERLMPGKSLNEICNLEKKCEIFRDVANRFNIRITDECQLPFYDEIFYRSVDLANLDYEKYQMVMKLLARATKFFGEIKNIDEGNYLLHSDMFADNILKDNSGWKAIDPHGFIGNRIFDTAIFMQKELESQGYSENSIDEVLSTMSKVCGYKVEDLKKTLFINQVLKIFWSLESNLDEKYIKNFIDNAKTIYNSISCNEKTRKNTI